MKNTYTFKVEVKTEIHGSIYTDHEITVEAENQEQAEEFLDNKVYDLDIEFDPYDVELDNNLIRFDLINLKEHNTNYRCSNTKDMFKDE